MFIPEMVVGAFIGSVVTFVVLSFAAAMLRKKGQK